MTDRYAFIMAGGKGERFWPQSRESRPKQFLSLFSKESLIEQTVSRIAASVPKKHIFIITNRSYAEPVRDLLPDLPEENIIGEPCRRDTAPCVALAAGIVKSLNPDAIMMMFPSDSAIVRLDDFRKDLDLACESAKDRIVTLGITPTRPSPDYGYIEAENTEKISPVSCFLEKPTVEKAKKLIASGNYLWNSGMFIWKVGTILSAFARFVPEMGDFAEGIAKHWGKSDFDKFLESGFQKQQKISIDYAVMEKEKNISVIRASFDWDDVGNWSALRNHFPADPDSNIVSGLSRLLDCKNSIVFNSENEHLIAGIDLDGVTVVHSKDATLVCKADSGAKLKELLKKLSENPDMRKFI